MKTVFWLALVAGFGGTLAGAHFVPWLAHARLPSHTSVVANGGRVIALTALGDNLAAALAKANAAAEKITWKDRYYRRDIGFDLK